MASSTNDNSDDDLIPRNYQVELMNMALERNTIIYLPTGSGKTFIAVMILKRMAAAIEKQPNGQGKITVLLVNTVALVDQHCNGLKRHTPFTIGGYSGDMNTDFWSREKWIEEYRKYQVFVMTTQIFLNIVLSSFLSLENVNLIIFDECHHAVEDHSMRQLMKFVQDLTIPPRVVGLTATLLNKNCKINKIIEEIKKLEVTYSSSVATVTDLDKVYGFSTNPKEYVEVYANHQLSNVENTVIKFLEGLIATLNVLKIEEKEPRNDALEELDCNDKTKVLTNLVKDVIKAVETFGIFGGYIAIQSLMIGLERCRRQTSIKVLAFCLNAMNSACMRCKALLDQTMKDSQNKVHDFSSPKINKLFDILSIQKRSCSKSFLGIIFVERRSTAKILYHILKKLKENDSRYNFIKPDFIVGFSNNPNLITRASLYTSKINRRILDSFTNEDLNLIIATTVIEEGIDVPRCTFVCKFDPPLNYRSYVQSKGRARSKESSYYIMVNVKDAAKFESVYENFKTTETVLNTYLLSSNNTRDGPSQDELDRMYEEDEVPPYYVSDNPNSACVNMLSAISLLSRYCQTLYTDLYTVQQPKWLLDKKCKNKCRIVIELPTVCPLIDPIKGEGKTKKSAKRKAALEACKLLHKMGELDNDLLPKDKTTLENIDHLFTHWPKEHTAQTQKRRNHLKQFPSYIKGNLSGNSSVYLHIIHIEPTFSSVNPITKTMFDLYNADLTYGLISSKELPTLCSFPIFVTQGEIDVSLLANYKEIHLNQDQLNGIKHFNYLVFNDLLKILHSFLVIDIENENNKIFCVPVDKRNDYNIDFDVILNNKELLPIMEPTTIQRHSIAVNDDTYLYKIITPWYRSDDTDYVVKEVTDLNASSSFPSEDIRTYAEYYQTKYNQTVFNESNPLVLVKALSKRLNCIKPRGVAKSKRKNIFDTEVEDIHLLPELCVKQEFPSSLWAQALILPTILEKIYQLLKAEVLRKTIALETNIDIKKNTSWKPLCIKFLEHYKEHVPDSTPLVMNLAQTTDAELNTSKLNKEFKSKMLEKQYPWADMEEPIDIERNLNVTALDVQNYVNFISEHLTLNQRELRNNVQHNTLSIEYNTDFIHKNIESITNEKTDGPELREIYEVLCTAKANDIVNLERYETLGDSFLKLIVSLYINLKYSHYDEGRATILKSKLISNKNLYYIGIQKNLGGLLKACDFEPKSQWIPPGFTIPACIKKAYDNGKFISKFIHKVCLSPEEQISGKLTKETFNYIFSPDFIEDDDYESCENQSSKVFFDYQEVADKSVADVVEALLGIYYKSCGLKGGVKLLEWFEIIPKSENLLNLIQSSPPSPVLNPKATQRDIDYLIPCWKQIENKIGYTFKNRAYLLQALTHSSYSPNRITRSYETLEFIGDAVLDFLITCFIFETCGNLTPGELTDLRSALVNNITFACYTVRWEFHKYLLSLNTKLEADIQKFVMYQENNGFAVTDSILILLNENDIHIAENVDCPKILGDLFEALAGAVYLDSGYDLNLVWKVFYKIMWQEIRQFSKNVPKNVVRLIYEMPGAHPYFHNPTSVPDGAIMVKLDIMMDGSRKRVYGFGDNKKNAKKAASKIALRVMHN